MDTVEYRVVMHIVEKREMERTSRDVGEDGVIRSSAGGGGGGGAVNVPRWTTASRGHPVVAECPVYNRLIPLSYIFYAGVSLAVVSSELSSTLATARYSCPDNAVGLVAQCELSGYVKLGWGNFHTDLATLLHLEC